MSIKRYEFDYRGDSCESSNGEWVRYADHAEEIAALRARAERLAACIRARDAYDKSKDEWGKYIRSARAAVDAHRDLEGRNPTP